MGKPKLIPHAYVLAVHDLEGSAAYFVDLLGFQREWAEPHNWECLVRDGVRVMIGRCSEALSILSWAITPTERLYKRGPSHAPGQGGAF
jgi:hypothetical protein